MPKAKLGFDQIGELGGGALKLQADLAIQMILADLHNRPALDKKRRVTVHLDFEPRVDLQSADPKLKSASVGFKIEHKIPGVSVDETICAVGTSGDLYFDADVPDAGDDPTLMDEADRQRREAIEASKASLKIGVG